MFGIGEYILFKDLNFERNNLLKLPLQWIPKLPMFILFHYKLYFLHIERECTILSVKSSSAKNPTASNKPLD